MTASTARRSPVHHAASKASSHWSRLAETARARALEQRRLADEAQDRDAAAPHVAQSEHLIRLAEDYEKQATCA